MRVRRQKGVVGGGEMRQIATIARIVVIAKVKHAIDFVGDSALERERVSTAFLGRQHILGILRWRRARCGELRLAQNDKVQKMIIEIFRMICYCVANCVLAKMR